MRVRVHTRPLNNGEGRAAIIVTLRITEADAGLAEGAPRREAEGALPRGAGLSPCGGRLSDAVCVPAKKYKRNAKLCVSKI